VAGVKRSAMKRASNSERKADRELRKRLAREFHRRVTRASCVMCANEVLDAEIRKTFAPELLKREAHHVVAKQRLKTEIGMTETDERMWAAENGVCLCEYHHRRHELYVQRLPRRLVPKAAVLFASALGLGWAVDLDYPPAPPPCDRCGSKESAWTGMSWLCADCKHEFRTFDE
jgi:hypothetical protein